MPATWSRKDERQYKHILQSCRGRTRRSVASCKRMAAATVNKTRQREGRTLDALHVYFGETPPHPSEVEKWLLLGIPMLGLGAMLLLSKASRD